MRKLLREQQFYSKNEGFKSQNSSILLGKSKNCKILNYYQNASISRQSYTRARGHDSQGRAQKSKSSSMLVSSRLQLRRELENQYTNDAVKMIEEFKENEKKRKQTLENQKIKRAATSLKISRKNIGQKISDLYVMRANTTKNIWKRNNEMNNSFGFGNQKSEIIIKTAYNQKAIKVNFIFYNYKIENT